MVIADGVVGLDKADKVSRDQLRPLVDQLVKRVLAICTRLAPDDGARARINTIAFPVDKLSVGLHVALLKVGGEAVHVLVVWEKCVRLGAVEVVVPDAEQGQDNGRVLLQRCGAEVLVQGVTALEELLKVVHADAEGDGHADGRPEGVAAAHPLAGRRTATSDAGSVA